MLFLWRNRYSIGSSIVRMWPVFCAIAVVDHRRQRRRLARAGRTRDQHEPALFHHELEQHRRQLQLLERGNVAAHVPDDQRYRAALAEDVDPEVADGRVEMRQVHLELALERPGLVLAHQLVGHTADRVDVHRLARQGCDDPVDLHADRRAARDEEVRRLFFGHQLEQSVEIHLARLRATMGRRAGRCVNRERGAEAACSMHDPAVDSDDNVMI